MTEVEEKEHRKVFGNLSRETAFLGVPFIHTLNACLPLHYGEVQEELFIVLEITS